ncbi:hypothetical protein [Clostridium senegalense]|nr:hypothetical protein [Clostridium senegalense]
MKLLGIGFEFLDRSIKVRRASSVSEENKFTVPIPFVIELYLEKYLT